MKISICLKAIFILTFFLITGFQVTSDKHRASNQNVSLENSNIILTEIMYDPLGSEYYDEFVEIYNVSVIDSIDLSGWKIGDGEGFDQITDAGFGLKLGPGQFGLIMDAGYFDHSATYDSLIPPETLLLTIDGASFGQRGWSNSSEKPVILLDSSGANIDEYIYSLGNQAGFSDEKIYLIDDNSQQNWQDSYQLNGTPGFYNSVSPRPNDLSLQLMSSPDVHPSVNETWQITLKIENVGIYPADQFQLVVFFYSGGIDSVQIYEKTFHQMLSSNEEIIQTINLKVNSPGLKKFQFFLYWQKDENLKNNSIGYWEKIPFEPGNIVINEIMYYSQINSFEWLEIYNSSDYTINLENWTIATEPSTDKGEIISNRILNFGKNDYLVLCGDSLFCEIQGNKWIYMKDFPRLRDTSEDLFLFDPFDNLVDKAAYESTWGKKRGFSLERIWFERNGTDSANWKLSEKLNGTPGFFNSRSPLGTDVLLSSLIAKPNPVPFASDTDISFVIKNFGRTEINRIEFNIFFDFNLDSIPQADELIFPEQRLEIELGIEDSIQQNFRLSNLSSGISQLSVLISANGDQNKNNNLKSLELKVGYTFNSVIINEILYHPYPNESEWIEIFNPSNVEINLRDWSLVEPFSEKIYSITSENVYLNPNTFMVISADSGIAEVMNSNYIVPTKFPSLNNDEEKIKLMDFSNTVIDSLHYYSTWGGEVGISLERINPNLFSNDSSNWASSASPFGKTPGVQNSIFVESMPPDATISISPNPFSPDGDGHEDFTIIQYDLPMTTAYVSVKIFDLLGRQVCDLLNTAISGSHREIIWNGKKNNGESLRIGVYIIFLEALNAQKGLVKQVKKPIVIAGKL